MIFHIENDGFNFQELDLEVRDFITRFPSTMNMVEIYDFSQHNMALSPYWELMATGFSSIEGNENRMPDITYWIGATLVLSPRAYRYLGDLLSPYGEFLPVRVADDTYQIFNCLTAVEGSMALSETDGKVVFKAPWEPWESLPSLFCSKQLREAIETFDLAGVVFEEV